MAYLYGASVQGIQGFIFESNELKTIIGASEIIKELDNLNFKYAFGLLGEPKVLLQAAGNIRLGIEDKDDAQKIVNILPKYIMQKAYGVTVSQALLEKSASAKLELERKLKIQRNKVSLPLDTSIGILKPAPKNARPTYRREQKEFISKGTHQKLEAQESYKKSLENKGEYIGEVSKLSNNKNKVAIIHADGNGLGDIVRHYVGDDMAEFSAALDEATKAAFKSAKSKICKGKYREVILGGDDMTMICDADYALDFIEKYLSDFEQKTQEKLKKFKNSIDLDSYTGTMTACAGVTFCHKNYPFHFAVELAEDLCKQAKERSGRSASCVMLHNNTGSYYDGFDNLKKRELEAGSISFDFGPYYISRDDKPRLETLVELHNYLKSTENAPLSSLREWIEELSDNIGNSEVLLQRISSNTPQDIKDKVDALLAQLDEGIKLSQPCLEHKTPIFDILQLEASTTAKGLK